MSEKICVTPWCTAIVIGRRPNALYCSDQCKKEFRKSAEYKKRAKSQVGDFNPRVCGYDLCCNFIVPKKRTDAYCSKYCQKKQGVIKHRDIYAADPYRYAEARESYRLEHLEDWAENIRRRRNKIRASGQEFYYAWEIYERDEWICQLCFEAVDPLLKFPEYLSASVDHILPVSLGGSDTRDNVQLAHLDCNRRKGNRVAGQKG